jgi:hypothetical protein
MKTGNAHFRKQDEVSAPGNASPGLPGYVVTAIESGFQAGNPVGALNLLRDTRDRFYYAAVKYVLAALKKSRGIPEHKHVQFVVRSTPQGWFIAHGVWSDDPRDGTIQLEGYALRHPASFDPA